MVLLLEEKGRSGAARLKTDVQDAYHIERCFDCATDSFNSKAAMTRERW
jgi:hypothetical protein